MFQMGKMYLLRSADEATIEVVLLATAHVPLTLNGRCSCAGGSWPRDLSAAQSHHITRHAAL